VSDHVEILYNIDIQAQKKAQALGIRLERPPALNEDPLFIVKKISTAGLRKLLFIFY
jgi:ferrochelatase